MIFSSRRLIARRFEPRDLEAFVAMRNDPEVARYQSWEHFTREDGERFIEGLSRQQPGLPGWFQFALEERSTGAFIGDCGLNIFAHDNRLAEIGYTIAPAYWNKGYATEAVSALISHAFRAHALHRISAGTDPRNTASRCVLEKSGFREEGHARQNMWFKGSWADDVTYAILRTEHEAAILRWNP